MTYEMFRLIFIIAAILSAVMLSISVLLFFLLKVPKLVGDLSGRNARLAIESIRAQNFSTGEKVYGPSPVNKERGKITDNIASGHAVSGGLLYGTIMTDNLEAQSYMNETTLLPAVEAQSFTNETTVLPAINETTTADTPDSVTIGGGITIIGEMTFIHTDEVIE
jgi:hypothetical protein